jgi:hypothetical protein
MQYLISAFKDNVFGDVQGRFVYRGRSASGSGSGAKQGATSGKSTKTRTMLRNDAEEFLFETWSCLKICVFCMYDCFNHGHIARKFEDNPDKLIIVNAER